MKWGQRNKIAEKWRKPVIFQVARSLLYVHYVLYFILLFQQSIHGLHYAKIREKV